MSPLAVSDPPAESSRVGATVKAQDLRQKPDEIEVWCASLDGHSEGAMRLMDSLLSPDESARARSFRFDRDRRRYVAGRGILRSLLGRYVDCAPENVRFTYGPHGKPAIADDTVGRRNGEEASQLHFNLAHSEGLALYAFTYAGPVGIDVEFIRDVPDWPQVAEVVFTASELTRLRACPPERRVDEFFRGWTRQEAVLKASGKGIGAAKEPEPDSRYYVYPLSPAPGFVGALAVTSIAQWVTLRRWPREGQAPPNAAEWRNKRLRRADLSAGATNFL